MMDSLLRELRNAALSQMVMPGHRFFKPTEAFYEALSEYKHLNFVDAGTGSGQLPEEAMERGFRMVGIDLVERPGQSNNVVFMEAESFEYSKATWLLMCRPDHSGWVYDTLEAALKRGAGAFYVSKLSNLIRDLEDYASRASRVWKDVGEDGEAMFLFLPEDLITDENRYDFD